MTGQGAAHGAVTILNATATGIGCSLAVEGGVQATWDWRDEPGLDLTADPPCDDRLARAVQSLLHKETSAAGGATVTTQAATGASRGLKTSSAAAAALLRAGLDAQDLAWNDEQVLHAAVQASRAAGVTLTGALDDQAAVTLGGCHLTDNTAGRIACAFPTEAWDVAIWVPDHAISKGDLAGLDASAIADEARAAERLARDGDLPGALSNNGRAFAAFYAAAGLPVTHAPAEAALAAGALGAGLSGTGPAVAALFTPGERPALEAVPGGAWTWTKVVEASA
ncbi:MAG: shikimate kinase [Thermoplasmatota archaeon]